jgi:hypothetical protein
VLTFRADDSQEVTVVFPGGIAVALALAGKSLDIQAVVGGRPALVRSDIDALPLVTVDIVERRGPEEEGG